MIRRIVLAAALAVGALSVLSAPPPATAAAACFSQGVMRLSEPLAYAAVETVSFTYTASLKAGCNSVTMSGGLEGTCARLSGDGTVTIDGASYSFSMEGFAGEITFTGGVVGFGYMTTNPTHSGNCLNAAARDFLLTAFLSAAERVGATA